jgi:hypothetical protein
MRAEASPLPTAPITAQLLQELNDAIEERRVQDGIAMLNSMHCKRIEMTELGSHQASFMLCLAQCT